MSFVHLDHLQVSSLFKSHALPRYKRICFRAPWDTPACPLELKSHWNEVAAPTSAEGSIPPFLVKIQNQYSLGSQTAKLWIADRLQPLQQLDIISGSSLPCTRCLRNDTSTCKVCVPGPAVAAASSVPVCRLFCNGKTITWLRDVTWGEILHDHFQQNFANVSCEKKIASACICTKPACHCIHRTWPQRIAHGWLWPRSWSFWPQKIWKNLEIWSWYILIPFL